MEDTTVLRDKISKVLQMTDAQLREISRFHVREVENGAGWETVTGFCCLGGCDMDVYPFPSERDALLFSVMLKEIGYRPPHNVACHACYEEHMKDCL